MKIRSIKIGILLLFLLFSLNSCLQDKCSSISCENGICVDGRCACQYGYEGDFCQDPWYAKFLGSWQAEESIVKDTTINNFQIEVQFSRTVDTFKLSGFADTLGDVYCTRQSSTTFNMLPTEVSSSIKLVSGSGTIDTVLSKVTGVYSFTKDEQEMSVNFIWTK